MQKFLDSASSTTGTNADLFLFPRYSSNTTYNRQNRHIAPANGASSVNSRARNRHLLLTRRQLTVTRVDLPVLLQFPNFVREKVL